VPIVLKFGSLEVLESSGCVQARRGTVLPSLLLFIITSFLSICNLCALSVSYLHGFAHILNPTEQPAAQGLVGDS
jgi:hypothetical protein